jgi:hypothetical protein
VHKGLLSTGDLGSQRLGQQFNYDFNSTTTALQAAHNIYEEKVTGYKKENAENNQEIILATEANKAYHFVNCVDSSGAYNIRYFIAYTLKNDTNEPILVDSKLLTGTSLNSKYTLSLDFNEPVECRYDFLESDFDRLRYKFDCEQYSKYGLYACLSDIINIGPTIYLECKDQPVNYNEYFINVEKGNGTVFENGTQCQDCASISYNNDEYTINKPEIFEIKGKSVLSRSDNTTIKFIFSRTKKCKKTTGNAEYDQISTEFDCNWQENIYVCVSKFGKGQYRVICQNDLISKRNSRKYTLNYN